MDFSGDRNSLSPLIGFEGHAFFGDFAQITQAEHLKAARIGEDGFVPANKLVQAAKLADDVQPRRSHR